MFASITCPACRHKYTIPEGAMGNRQVCPNCQSPFLAGKSASEADVPMKYQPAAPGAINKTMLGETAPPIRYNCPRCKKPLESPAIEAGIKKPCPACGQRLQVPAAPIAAAPAPNLNKTILASDESSGQPHGVAAGLPPAAGAPLTPAPASAAAGSTVGSGMAKPSARMLLIGGIAAGVVLLLLLTCTIAMLFTGPSSAERERIAKAQKDYENAKKDIEELKKSIVEREAMVAKTKQIEMEHQRQMDALLAENKARQDKLNLQRELDRIRNGNDERKAAEAKALADQQQAALDDAKRAALLQQQKSELELKTKLASLETELAAQKQRAQQATTIIAQPPPAYYYPPYHPRYYWGW